MHFCLIGACLFNILRYAFLFNRCISLIDENNIISEKKEIAEIFNDFFSTAATNLEIDKSEIYITEVIDINDPIFKAIKKYEMHPLLFNIYINDILFF